MEDKLEDGKEKMKELDDRHTAEIDELRNQIAGISQRLSKAEGKINSNENMHMINGVTATSIESI